MQDDTSFSKVVVLGYSKYSVMHKFPQRMHVFLVLCHLNVCRASDSRLPPPGCRLIDGVWLDIE